MLILNNEQAYSYHPVIRFIPYRLRKYLTLVHIEDAEEIRLRKGQPMMLYKGAVGWFINGKGLLCDTADEAVVVGEDDIKEALELVSESSLYAVEDSVKNGYITVNGGHRVGICGSAVLKNGKVYTIKNISGLNYRLSREIYGAADLLMNSVLRDNKILNTLIISPPGCGKTTLLRDLIRQISLKGFKVSVADERNEISAIYNGYKGYDLGFSCDVLEGAPKGEAMTILIRSMGPQVVATDEIGTAEDIEVIKRAARSGVAVLSSIHCKNRKKLVEKYTEIAQLFECFVTLSDRNGPGTIEEIYCGI